MNKHIYVYYPTSDSYGIMVIIRRLIEKLSIIGIDSTFINNLDGRSKNDFIIPYSTTTALELIRKGFETKLCLMVDAYSLGELNKVKFYLSKGRVFQYDFVYSIYAYLRAIIEEKLVLRAYENVMLVSQTDIEYLKTISKSSVKYICIPNGVDIPDIAPKIRSDKLRLGILSSWSNIVSYQENDWFIRSFYMQYIKTNKNVELLIAGRGDYASRYSKLPQVKYIGEVADLNDFFSNIDIFLAVNPKGCGILNRVLDAFSFKVPVIGYEPSFSGFKYMKDSYLTFKNYEEFSQQIAFLINHKEEARLMSDNAYSELLRHNNWDKNYSELVSFIKNIISI